MGSLAPIAPVLPGKGVYSLAEYTAPRGGSRRMRSKRRMKRRRAGGGHVTVGCGGGLGGVDLRGLGCGVDVGVDIVWVVGCGGGVGVVVGGGRGGNGGFVL
jgi:hypothetical protein